MLLQGKLVDLYIELGDDIKKDMKQLKVVLMGKAGLIQDPLSAGKKFISRSQGEEEKVDEFGCTLKTLFKQAHPDKDLSSSILLQRFLTSLTPCLARQLLLHGQPDTLDRAIKEAIVRS